MVTIINYNTIKNHSSVLFNIQNPTVDSVKISSQAFVTFLVEYYNINYSTKKVTKACESVLLSKGLSTLDAFASRHGMDPFRQFVKLGVIT